jgi:hypothetical protein
MVKRNRDVLGIITLKATTRFSTLRSSVQSKSRFAAKPPVPKMFNVQ